MADEEKKSDAAEELRPVVEGLIQAVQVLAQKLDAVEGAHGMLEKLVVDDLIGGISSMYKANMKKGRIESLKSKYSGDLQGHFDALAHISPEGTDHWGALHDMTEGMDDTGLDDHVKNLASGLADKLGKIRGKTDAPAAAEVSVEAPAAVETPAEPEGPPAKEKSQDEQIAEKLSKSKGFKTR